MDNYDEMASAVDKILLESTFGRRRNKRRSHDKEKTEFQPLNATSAERDGRIFKRNTAAIENQRFFRVNGANGNKVDGDARKIKEHLNSTFGRRRNKLRIHDKEKTEFQPLNANSAALDGRIFKRNTAAIQNQRFFRVNGANGNKQENDYEQNKAFRKFSERFKAAVTKTENETEMETAVDEMMVYLTESGKRDENEIDVAGRKTIEILNEFHRISFERDMLQKGKSVGKCIGSFNTLEDKFLDRISEPNIDINNLLTELEKRKFEYVETQIREMEYAITSLQNEIDALAMAVEKINFSYLMDTSSRHLKMNGKYEEALRKLHLAVQFLREHIRERSNITQPSLSDTLPFLERMVTDPNELTTSPTPNAMAPPNVSFSESQKTP
ncbi:hypothetical protein Bhyg_08110, partial [Pseudolycoriella hygida]